MENNLRELIKDSLKKCETRQAISDVFDNALNAMYKHSSDLPKHFKDWVEPPTKGIIYADVMKPLIKKTVYKTFNKCGKPYLVGCVVCLYERDRENQVFADYRFGYATVHPNDKFNENLGKSIALERALNNGTGSHGLYTKKLQRAVDDFERPFLDEMTYSPLMMLDLVRKAMPTIVRNKVFNEYAVETDKDNITWLKK